MYVLNNKSINPNKVRLTLHEPFGKQEKKANLNEAYDRTVTFKLTGELHELSFSLPFEKIVRHELVKNKNIDKIREFYLVRFKYMKIDEWFIVKNVTNDMSDSGDSKKITCVHLPYELTFDTIRSFNQSGLNCRTVLEGGAPKRDSEGNILTDAEGNPIDVGGVLADTNWTIGTIDASFETSTRTFDWDEVTILDAVYQIAETYDGFVTFDTHNRTVSITKPPSRYQNFIIGYGKYAQSMNQSSDIEAVYNRVRAVGRDGLTFSSINPSGLNYIDDYSYHLYPFSRDESTKTVIQSSYLLPDDVCHALLDYQALIESKSGILTKLFDDLNARQKTLDERSFELSNLEIEMKTIDDNLEVDKALGKDLTNLKLKKASKQKEIDDKKATITSLENAQSGVRAQIKTLQEELSPTNNFTEEQQRELKRIRKTSTFTDDKCITPEDLMARAKEEMERIKYPVLTVTTDIVDLFSILEEHRNWNRLQLGDTVRIRYNKIDIDVKAQVTEMTHDFDNQTISLTITNAKKTEMSTKERVFNKIDQSYSTSTSVSMNKSSWSAGNKALNKVNDYINNELDATKQRIKAGVNNSVTIDGKGMVTTSLSNPNDIIIIQGGLLAISRDGGENWQTAITADGVIAERLTGRILAGESLTIDASDNNNVKTFTVDGNGVWLNGTSLYITGEKNENLINSWNSSIKQGELYNGVKIDLAEGLVVERSDAKVRTVLNAITGLSMQAKKGSEWANKFYIDTDGNLQAEDIIAKRIIIAGSDGKPLIDANTGTINFENFTVRNGKIPAENVDINIANIGITDKNITGIISKEKLDLSNALKGTTVTDVDGNATLIISNEGKVSIPSQSSDTSFNNAIFTGDTKVNNTLNVKETLTAESNVSVGGLLDLSNAKVKWNQNTKGVNVVVPAYAGSIDITGLLLSNANYGVSISPHWRTSFWVENKTATGFTVNFSIPSETPVTFDWFLF
ncbi:phage tail protein [Priestia sp. SB1]|uniref:phage tail protein n=1 Tax=Priestia sp. SB1 TaxID=3132359 RepID=UPI0031720D7B